jgi:hypothetical protein
MGDIGYGRLRLRFRFVFSLFDSSVDRRLLHCTDNNSDSLYPMLYHLCRVELTRPASG